ncbi:MAG: SpoIIE family protein phosphatase [Candidatus Riflebacteria bacterium]|nr:SpoIIE family protein phosphatase [Candidatus Riflebacteria bacterium]
MNGGHPHPAPLWQKGLPSLVIAFFLAGFPLLLADGGLGYLLDIRAQNRERAVFRELEDRLQRLLALRNPDHVLRRTLRRLGGLADRDRDPIGRAGRLANALVRKYPRLFTITVFDAAGRQRFQVGGRESRRVGERLLALLKEYQAGRRGMQAIIQPVFAEYLGCGSLQNRVRRVLVSDWALISPTRRKNWFFQHWGKGFTLFAQVHREGFSPTLGVEWALRRPSPGPDRLDLIDAERLHLRTPQDPETDRTVLTVMARLLREPLAHFAGHARLWVTAAVTPQFHLLISRPFDPAHDFADTRGPFRGAALILFLAAWAVAWWWLVATPPPWVSLRWKLLALFLLTAGLPLAILACLLAAWLREREELATFRAEAEAHQVLETLEDRFPQVRRYLENRFQRVLAAANLRSPTGRTRLLDSLAGFIASTYSRGARLLGTASQDLQITPSGLERTPRGDLTTRLLHTILNHIRGENRKEDQMLRMQLGVGVEQAIGTSFDTMIDHLTEQEGRLSPISFGTVEGWIVFRTLTDPRGEPDYLVAMQWNLDNLETLFLDRFLPRKPLDDGTRLLAIGWEVVGRAPTATHGSPSPQEHLSQAGGTGSPDSPPQPFQRFYRVYPRYRLSPRFQRFFRGVAIRQRPMTRTLDWNGQPHLVAARPGEAIPSYGLFALKPLAPLYREIEDMKWRAGVFALLSLGFTSLLGLFLARRFLGPVGDIARAVGAVQFERYSHRIPPQDPDELGDLAVLFNRMAESLGEVSVARSVQEDLLPQEALQVGTVAVFGRSRPATDLGGDYFDYLARPDGRVLVVHGDVTGHGVPSALGMAIAKGVFNLLGNGEAAPMDVLAGINGVMLRTLRRKRAMTLALLAIDGATGEALLLNGGNPYPIRLPHGGKPAFLTSRGQMIGMSARLRVTPETFRLEQGDRLIFYSDGLVESLEGLARPGTAAIAAGGATAGTALPTGMTRDGNDARHGGRHEAPVSRPAKGPPGTGGSPGTDHGPTPPEAAPASAYDTFLDFVANLPDLPLQSFVQALLERHPALAAGGEQPDDFTVVVVERVAPLLAPDREKTVS